MYPSQSSFLKRTAALTLMAALLLCLSAPAFSQQPPAGELTVSNIDTTGFPTIAFRMGVFGAEGQFVSDLTFADVQVIEDGAPQALDDLQIVQPGMQIITTFAPAPIFADKVGGVTIIETLKNHFIAWAQSQPEDSPDEFSIATSTGMLAIRLKDPNLWVEALSAYQPDLLQAQTTLVSLSQALDLAADPSAQPGQRQVIFYVTALPPANALTSLEGLSDLAESLGVRVNVIAVTNSAQVPLQTSEPLIRLAERTGGAFFVYTGTETLPNLEAALQPLRYQYQASYTSRVNISGQHTLQVQLLSQELPLTSQTATIDIDVQPPNPIFLSPPVTINRGWSEPANRSGERQLMPGSQTIQMLVEFPDGHTRPLQSATLYANGVAVAENSAAPFDSFNLPLDSYTSDTSLLLQVEVIDSLGLSARSIEVPVEIVVAHEPQRFWGDIVTLERSLIAGALLLAAVILVVVLLLSGNRKKALSSRARRDPVTQPVAIRQVKPAKTRPSANTPPISEAGTSAPVSALARLVPLSETGAPMIENTVPLNHNDIILGSDPGRANPVLTHPSVHPQHCRITWSPNGRISIMDLGSAAGTWINYEQLTRDSRPLAHGDLLHIGRLAFRFELATPPNRRPVVSPFEEDEP